LTTLAGAFVPHAEAARKATVPLPLPAPGNISVSRLTIEAPSGIAVTPPPLSVANAPTVGRRALVVSAFKRGSARKFFVTIAAVGNIVGGSAGAASGAPGTFTLKVPSPYRVVSVPQTASDVLYQNRVPPFPLLLGGTAGALAGNIPGQLPAERLVRDAQLLAFDRAVPLADMGLIGLPYVTAHVPTAKTKVSLAVGLTRLNQVNALQLQFPTGVRVVAVAGPEGTSPSIVSTGTLQLVASTAFFQEGVPYIFDVTFSRPLRRGEQLTLRASTHYFESTLPFTERFLLS
jgi:hypothetical protein